MATTAQAGRAKNALYELLRDDPYFVGIDLIRRDNSVLIRLSAEPAFAIPDVVEGARVRVELVRNTDDGAS